MMDYGIMERSYLQEMIQSITLVDRKNRKELSRRGNQKENEQSTMKMEL